MNAVLPLALSLSSTFTKIGAIAAFAALLGIAILSMLVFSQAREIKRLREWAGRAPERASELEQRVSADAAARVQRTAAPVAAARVVPRKTPLVSAPVSTAVHATAANATGLAIPPAPGTPSGQTPPVPGSTVPAAAPVTASGAPAPHEARLETSATQPGAANGPATDAAQAPAESVAGTGTPAPATAAAKAAPMLLGTAGVLESSPESADGGKPASGAAPPTPAPATVAGQVSGVAARPSLPPSPASPSPPGMPASSTILPASAPSSDAVAPPRPASSPPAPVAAARRTPSRLVAASAAGASPRSPVPSRADAAAGGGPASGRVPDRQPSVAGPKYFKPERSPARRTALIAGGVIVIVVLVVVAVLALKGGGSSTAATHSSVSSSTKARPADERTDASNPADVAVTVLNGTETNDLAHHLASDLQQSGYTHAEASTAVPPGTHATTVVEYAAGHRADGQAVAKALDVKRVQAIEGTIASLAGSATIVVLAGADQAAQLGGGGAQSKGEPAASGGGTGEAASGSAAGSGESGAGTGEGAAGSGN